MSSPENIHPTFGQLLGREAKEALLKQRGSVVWLYGLSGSGKSTLANLLLGQNSSPVQVTATQLPPVWYQLGTPGAQRIGLLTGDQAINGDADVVVMTTEVLRNMLYADSPALQGLSHVVMDEVHFLADRMRGAVWEEVILHLPDDVRLVSLSATVSNAEEFGAWMETVRGDTTVVVDENRPVPLSQHIMVGRRLFDLFDTRAQSGDGAARLVVDRELVRHVKQRQALDHADRWQPAHGRGRGRSSGRTSANNRPLPRPDVIAKLDQEGLLPAITFIFSRAGCDGALTQCLRSRLVLTTPEQAEEIRYIVEQHTSELPREDLEVLGFWEWREALERGLAAHHAGIDRKSVV